MALKEKMDEELASIKEDEEPQDIFGMSPEDWEDLEGKIGKAIQLAGQLADIWDFVGTSPRLPTDMYLLAVIICVLLFSCLWVYRRMMNSGRPSLRNGLRLKYGAEVVI